VLTKIYALVNESRWLIRNRLIDYSRIKTIMRIVINNRVKPLKCQLIGLILEFLREIGEMEKI